MRVLIAMEDEVFGAEIVRFVSSHLWESGTAFRLINVVEPTLVGDNITAIYGMGIDNEILKERVNSGTQLLSKFEQDFKSRLVDSMSIESRVVIGIPHHTILETAKEWHADLIALGSHGRKGLSRFFLGSVSLAVVSHAECSVSIVRLPKVHVS